MKVAIAGVGNVAKGSYLPALAKRSGIELHYWNRTAEKANAAAAQFGVPIFNADKIPGHPQQSVDGFYHMHRQAGDQGFTYNLKLFKG